MNNGTAAWMSTAGVTSNSKKGSQGLVPSTMASAVSLSTIATPPLPSPRA
jgi:hypothetical protein